MYGFQRIFSVFENDVLVLEKSPLCDAYAKEPKKQEFYDLTLCLCSSCNFVQIDTVINPEVIYRDYIYVQDVVEGIIRSIDIKDSYTINLGNGSYIKVKDFVAMFWNNLGGANNMLKFGSKAMLKNEPDQPKSFADLTRLDKLTNWKPSYSLEEGIQSTIEILYSEKGKEC